MYHGFRVFQCIVYLEFLGAIRLDEVILLKTPSINPSSKFQPMIPPISCEEILLVMIHPQTAISQPLVVIWLFNFQSNQKAQGC